MSRKKTVTDHILEANRSIMAAQEELKRELEKQGKIIDSHSKEIAELQDKVIEMRDNAIVLELRHLSGKAVAEKYNLTPGRISQIKKEKKQKERSTVVEVSENYSNLNPNYTFETFVVGNNNSIAAAAAEQVAKGGITSLNPLFIYGGPGLRKNSPYASYC